MLRTIGDEVNKDPMLHRNAVVKLHVKYRTANHKTPPRDADGTTRHCFRCGCLGHFVRDCMNHDGGLTVDKASDPRQCSYSGRHGHLVRQCLEADPKMVGRVVESSVPPMNLTKSVAAQKTKVRPVASAPAGGVWLMS